MAKSEIKWIRLGEFVVPSDKKNNEGLTLPVMGLNAQKSFMPTVANLTNVDLSKYKVVYPSNFAFSGMQTGRDECIRIAYSIDNKPFLISPAYTTFSINEDKDVLPAYIFMYFYRAEMDRYGWFISDSSVRANLDWSRLMDVRIPVPFKDGKPDIEQQKIVVDAWQGLRKMKEDNEQLVEPLMQLCRSYMEDLKKRYIPTRIGQFIEPVDERNTDLKIKLSQGINNKKYFQTPVQVAADSQSDKIVRKGYFAYNRATTRNSDKISIAYREGEDCTVSSSYQVFKIIDEETLNPHFLLLWFKRPEFDRYARFKSRGSAHEFFSFEEMEQVKIPIPSIEAQRAIADIYRCAENAKRIAEEADKLSREICPALMQHIIQTSKS